jgi:hypothetical protein
MPTPKLNHLAAAVALLIGTPAANALTPWSDGPPPDANTFYVSGGAAQDVAFGRVVLDSLALPGTLDVFGDATAVDSSNFGGRWTVYYFTGSSATGALAGKPIAIVKRSLGAAGYGVIPLIANPPIAIEELDLSASVFNTPPGAGNTTVFTETAGNAGTVPDARGNYRVVVTSANASTLLSLKTSTGGILGVDAELLLKPGTWNYPTTSARVGSGSDVFPTTLTNVPSNFAQVSTGGLVYGVAVTSDLYNVLQAAQKRSGQLPSTTVIGDYKTESRIPTLPSSLIGSLLAGKIKNWDEVKIVDRKAGSPTLNKPLPLTHATILADAGVTLPPKNSSNKVPVAVGIRNAGAAIGAQAYATFLNYPWTAGSFAPALVTNNLFDNTSAPIIKAPGGATATGLLLDDWNQGTNTSTLNLPSAKRWGVAINDATRNASGTAGLTPEAAGKQHWRYVRIDGYLPKIQHVASGSYKDWAEGVLLYDNNTIAPAAKTVLNALANGLASPTIAAKVNAGIVTTWGQTGIFGLTEGTAYTTDIPYKDSHPVVGYTRDNNGVLHTEIAPTYFDSSRANGVLLEGLPQ